MHKTVDVTTKEYADQLAADPNDFLDDIYYLHYFAGPATVAEIAVFLRSHLKGEFKRHDPVAAEIDRQRLDDELEAARQSAFETYLHSVRNRL